MSEIADTITGELAASIVGAYINAPPEVKARIGVEMNAVNNSRLTPDERLAAATRVHDILVETSSGAASERKPPQDVRIVETQWRMVGVYINGKLAYQDSMVDVDRLIRHLDNVRVHFIEITDREYDCLNRDFLPQDISEIEDRLEDPEPSEDDDG